MKQQDDMAAAQNERPDQSTNGGARESVCPFCGMHPYEYVDVGVGSVPVAVNCCQFAPLLFDWRTSEAHSKIAAEIAAKIAHMPHGDARYQCATDLFEAAFPSSTDANFSAGSNDSIEAKSTESGVSTESGSGASAEKGGEG